MNTATGINEEKAERRARIVKVLELTQGCGWNEILLHWRGWKETLGLPADTTFSIGTIEAEKAAIAQKRGFKTDASWDQIFPYGNGRAMCTGTANELGIPHPEQVGWIDVLERCKELAAELGIDNSSMHAIRAAQRKL